MVENKPKKNIMIVFLVLLVVALIFTITFISDNHVEQMRNKSITVNQTENETVEVTVVNMTINESFDLSESNEVNLTLNNT